MQRSEYVNPTKEIYWLCGPIYIFYVVVCTLQNGPHFSLFFLSLSLLYKNKIRKLHTSINNNGHITKFIRLLSHFELLWHKWDLNFYWLSFFSLIFCRDYLSVLEWTKKKKSEKKYIFYEKNGNVHFSCLYF